ncbi:MAG: DUF4249 family protein [Bacteroidota bacterium]|uniref:DUF4249 family protein n=1 Tax=Flagellimonas okinawensis TaxID=3031324 RepID=A0ABT5XJE9_9FLAO|nr:DUF4249 family protein [[Muricauda] okinawensis]MDF0706008.1 DUF4249 family protein [[Muricauda] okinawensis]MEC8832470.1 DUF4249 family protein [Bacteroidota bacterium]
MKKLMSLIFIFTVLVSCEDVVDVDLPDVDTKLVVDGLIRVDKDQEFVDVRIALRETSIFFEENEPVQAESVVISYGQLNNSGNFDNLSSSSLAEESPGSGIYVPDPNFSSDQRIRTTSAEPGTTFILEITYQGKYYFAQTEYAPTVPLDGVRQGDEVFFGEDQTEVIVSFTDNGDEDNYYVFDFMFGEFLTVEDEFFQGQQFEFSYFYDDKTNPGDEVTISILGATEEFYNYMDLVIEQTGNGGSPFQTPVATARGNIFDITGLDNVTVLDNVDRPNDYALGYFGVVQEYSQTLTIE